MKVIVEDSQSVALITALGRKDSMEAYAADRHPALAPFQFFSKVGA